MLLVVAALVAGRAVRHHLLIGPAGVWREHLWLDAVVADPGSNPDDVQNDEKPPCLTTPLPLNTCSVDSLTLLPGIGPVLADRIAAVRLAGAVFREQADLLQVKGIGPKLAARLSPHVLFATGPGEPAAASPEDTIR